MAGAGVDKGARAVVDLAFGSDAGKLNLGSVLQKAKETHATLCKLEAQLHADAPRLVATATSSSGRTHATRWSHALDLFLLLHHQYGGLRAAFRETLQFWSVYPRQVDAALAMKLQGGMISPRLLVTMEKDDETVLREARTDIAHEAVSSIHPPPSPSRRRPHPTRRSSNTPPSRHPKNRASPSTSMAWCRASSARRALSIRVPPRCAMRSPT